LFASEYGPSIPIAFQFKSLRLGSTLKCPQRRAGAIDVHPNRVIVDADGTAAACKQQIGEGKPLVVSFGETAEKAFEKLNDPDIFPGE